MTPKAPYPRLDLSRATTVPLSTRPRKVSKDLLAEPEKYNAALGGIEHLIPSVLAGQDIKLLADAWASAVRRGRSVVLGMGAHVIKVGLSRLIVDLIERGYLQGLAANGAAAIHDLEMALNGQTSEDVAEGLQSGAFGMAEETGRAYWDAVALAAHEGYGLGQAVGRLIMVSAAPHRRLSVFAPPTGDVPAVRIAIGRISPICRRRLAPTMISAFRDFQVFAEVVKGWMTGGHQSRLGCRCLRSF